MQNSEIAHLFYLLIIFPALPRIEQKLLKLRSNDDSPSQLIPIHIHRSLVEDSLRARNQN